MIDPDNASTFPEWPKVGRTVEGWFGSRCGDLRAVTKARGEPQAREDLARILSDAA